MFVLLLLLNIIYLFIYYAETTSKHKNTQICYRKNDCKLLSTLNVKATGFTTYNMQCILYLSSKSINTEMQNSNRNDICQRKSDFHGREKYSM